MVCTYLMLQLVGEDGNGARDQWEVLLCHRVAAVGSHTQRTSLHRARQGGAQMS